MDVSNLIIIIPVAAIVIGFVYFNFIFPKQAEKNEKQKKENEK